MKEYKIYHEIINNNKYKREMEFMQHGDYSVYDHSINVANACYMISKKLKLNVEMESLIKGALLHDYFLYDWHDKDPEHKFHAIDHARKAKDNSMRDFGLTKKEENMILSHMFPLGTVIPKYKESIILCLADKYCALSEVLNSNYYYRKAKEWVQS